MRWSVWCLSDPHGLTLTWWGCCSLCPWYKPSEFANSFLFCSCVYFCLYGPFNCISFHKSSREFSALLFCSFPSYFCPIGPFNYISLYESLPNPDSKLSWSSTRAAYCRPFCMDRSAGGWPSMILPSCLPFTRQASGKSNAFFGQEPSSTVTS